MQSVQGLLTNIVRPPATAVEAVQQQKINTAEKSAKELETILNVAESGIQTIINELQSSHAPISPLPTLPPAQQQTISQPPPHDIDRALHETLEEEFENPELNNYSTQNRVMQHKQLAAAANNIPTENLYDDLMEHSNSPLPPRKRLRPSRPLARPPQITVHVARKKMPTSISGYIAHKKIASPISRGETTTSSSSTSPIPQPRMKNCGTQMNHDIGTHNKIRSIFEDFCKGKTNTRHATHRIMDITHQVAKDNIR